MSQRRCDNVVTTSLLTLSQRCGTLENESCTDVSFRLCDNVALQRCQDVASTLLQRRHNINHWITRPFYYGLFWFLSLHRNVKVTKVLSGIKHVVFIVNKSIYIYIQTKWNILKLICLQWTQLFTFLHKQINWGHSLMASSKREVTKIWEILQMVTDNFFWRGVSFFRHM